MKRSCLRVEGDGRVSLPCANRNTSVRVLALPLDFNCCIHVANVVVSAETKDTCFKKRRVLLQAKG